jgi:hypothetical protein
MIHGSHIELEDGDLWGRNPDGRLVFKPGDQKGVYPCGIRCALDPYPKFDKRILVSEATEVISSEILDKYEWTEYSTSNPNPPGLFASVTS